MTRYNVIRFFADACIDNQMVRRNLTLAQAQAHCKNPETSSRTCSTREGTERTRKHGDWFDGYTDKENS